MLSPPPGALSHVVLASLVTTDNIGKTHKSIFSCKASFGHFSSTPTPPLQSVHPPKSIFLKETERNLRPINFQFADADLRCVFLMKLVLLGYRLFELSKAEKNSLELNYKTLFSQKSIFY